MTPVETLRALSRGDPAAARGLLPAARAQAFGAEAFGPAAMVELFARHARPLSDVPAAVLGERTLSLFDADPEGGEQGWLADLHDGRIARLWRVGEGPLDPEAEPGPPFAADPFLTQQRDPAAFRPEDYPDLPSDAAPALRELAARAALGPDDDGPAAQGRAFVVRALAGGGRGGALMAVTGVAAGAHRFAAAAFRHVGGELVHHRVVWDAARAAPALRSLAPPQV